MSGERLSDEQCLERLRAYNTFGSYKAAYEATGISRNSLKRGVETARERNLDAPEDANLILPDFPADDVPIEKLLDMAEERSQLRIASYDAHTWFPVKVTDDMPIGIMWFGDPHLDDNGCDWKLLRRHAHLCKTTPGLYGANIGDTTNNWAGRLAALYAKQDASQKTARRFASWLMLDSGIRWLLWLIGNHDQWGDGAEILALMAAKHKTQKIVCHDWEARFVLQFKNGAEFRINAAHDFAGNSMWNPLHGTVKAAKFGDKTDLLVCGHLHNWAISQWEMAEKGTIPVMIRVKGYKTNDDYARKLGHHEQKEGASILTIIDPRAETKAGRVTAFADVENGVEYLKFLRAKYANLPQSKRSKAA
jgi:hypothetical protein